MDFEWIETQKGNVRAMRNTAARVLVVGCASLLVGLAGGIASAANAPKSPLPQDWIDRSTGQIDFTRVPDRVKFSTDLSPSGYGWIDSDVLFGAELTDGMIVIYTSETGDTVLGYNDQKSGAMLDASRHATTGSESTPTTALVAPSVSASD